MTGVCTGYACHNTTQWSLLLLLLLLLLILQLLLLLLLQRQQVEDEAAASSSSGQERKLSGRQAHVEKQDPRKAGCPELEESTGSNLVGTGARKGQSAIKPVETHTWEEMEGAVRQGARGTAEGTMGYALTVLDQVRTDVEERF